MRERKGPIGIPRYWDSSRRSTERAQNISDRLSQLKRFETDLHNDEVVRAKTSMEQILRPRFPWFDARGIVITYHGSLQYNDPVHLDVDMQFVSENVHYEEFRETCQVLEHEFMHPGAWPRGRCDTNFLFTSLVEMKQEVDEKGDSTYNPDEDDQIADLAASLVLSSRLLFDSQSSLLAQFQAETKQLALKSKWLGDGIIYLLENTIAIRQQRR